MASASSSTSYAASDDLRQRKPANGNATKLVITEAGREADRRLDTHESYAALILHAQHSINAFFCFAQL